MKDLSETIQKALAGQLEARGYDIVDLVAIPTQGDRTVQIRTVEEALLDFDSTEGAEAMNYLVQVRPRRALEERKQSLDGIYSADGQMNVAFLLRNAEVLFAAGDFTLARNIYKTVLQTGEKSSVALYWIGRCLEAENRHDEAMRSYEESIAYHPTLDAFQRFAALLIRAKKDHQAAELLERTLTTKDLSPESRFDLHHTAGNSWLRADNAAKAEKHYLLAEAIRTDSDVIQASLGVLELQRGAIVAARKRFQRALAINTRCDKALSGLASCYLAEGDRRLAHDHFAKALDLNIVNPTAIYHLVKCAYEIKSYATAARILGEYLQSAPVNANLMYSLAGLQFHLGRLEEARGTAKRILELQPEHAGAADLIGLMDRYASP